MNIELNQSNKHIVWDFWQALENAAANEIEAVARLAMDGEMVWHGPDPINQLDGVEAFVSDFWLPVLHSFPDLKRQTHLFLGGKSNGRIDGDIKAAHLVIGSTGIVEGVVEAESVIVKGKIIGTLNAGEVRIQDSAHVHGDVFHDTLSIDAGAIIEGSLKQRFEKEDVDLIISESEYDEDQQYSKLNSKILKN